MASGLKVPAPPLHVPPVAVPPTLPANTILVDSEASRVWFGPALAVGSARMVTITCAVPGETSAGWPVVVRVSVTVPLESSAADGA